MLALVCSHCGREHRANIAICPLTGLSMADPGPCGTVIDRYEVIERIGKGGFGAVYRARHVHTLREVALKLLDPAATTDATVLMRFKREAQVVTTINSPHVVEVFDYGVLPSGQAFLVMELLDGSDLSSVIEPTSKLGVARALAIADQLLDGLGAVHAAGAIHRDLKPSNVFLTRIDGREIVKLLDFGCCRAREQDDDVLFATRTGTTIGTPLYMSPEQLRAGTVDVRSDLYSAAVVIYELVSGRRPHDGASYEDLVARVCTEDPTDLRGEAGVPDHVAAAVMRGLDRDPVRRWPSAREFARALRHEASAATVGTTPDRPVARRAQLATRPSASRARRYLPLLLVLALGGIAGGIAVRHLAARPPATRSPLIDAHVATPTVPQLDAAIVAVEAAPDAGPALPDAAVRRPLAGDNTPRRSCTRDRDCPDFNCRCRTEVRSLQWCDKGQCPSPTTGCTGACKLHGGWTGSYSVMTPIDSTDCKAAPQCKTEGKCSARRYHPSINSGSLSCVRSCRDLRSCSSMGLCSDGDGDSCVATSADDCKASSRCKDSGQCSVVGATCAVAGSADCEASRSCVQYARCTAVADRCMTTSSADCARSKLCTKEGRCSFANQRCVATGSP